MAEGCDWITGLHAVIEALASQNRDVHELWIERGARGRAVAVGQQAAAAGVAVREVDRSALDGLSIEVVQRIAARCSRFRYQPETDLAMARPGEPSIVVVLDRVQDPQNLGAIIRTAEVAGVRGVCLSKRHAVGVTPAVVRAAAGATEHIPIHAVTNVARCLLRLSSLGYWIIGLDQEAQVAWDAVDYRGPVVLVVGAEGKGLRRLVAERCDHRVALPVSGKIGSLNASAAFAAVIFEAVRQQRPVAPAEVGRILTK